MALEGDSEQRDPLSVMSGAGYDVRGGGQPTASRV